MCVLYCSDQREWAGRDYRCVYCIVAISGSGRDVTIDVCIVIVGDKGSGRDVTIDVCICIVAISRSGRDVTIDVCIVL